ncbi:MAG TPA: ABC transporter substrate-binding protein [Actinophytocola sp.]|jgi:NitT/TauT family transport system substrate-binding protein|nr:ABC transporter substrate-binding protein [Actinophytocola sp.]
MPKGVTGRGFRARLAMLGTAVVLVASLTSCGLLGESEDTGEQATGGSSGKLETSQIKVSIMKTTDLAPFHLAVKEGYFKDEGLDVKFVDSLSGGESVSKLVAGEVDMSYSSYTPFFLAESKNLGGTKGGIKLVADASSAGPGSCMVVATPGSSVKGIKDMAGKRVAVTATGTISDLLTMSTLKTNNVDWKGIKWVPTPFPQTAAALKNGDVDAAFVTEPFIQDTMKKAGAQPIFDTAVGPTADMPTAGWGSTGEFVQKNPNTIAAFQRAMLRGTDLALSDRGQVEPMLVEFSGVDGDTAKMATLLTFQSKLDATRIQRVPDLMREFDVIKKALDVKKMVVPTAKAG